MPATVAAHRSSTLLPRLLGLTLLALLGLLLAVGAQARPDSRGPAPAAGQAPATQLALGH